MARKIVLYLIVLIFVLAFWAFVIEPELFIVKKYKIKNEKLSGVKIVFASDFHVKKHQQKRLLKIVEKINSQNSDLVLLGGDFVNGQGVDETLDFDRVTAALALIKSSNGVISILGNHDFWSNPAFVREQLNKINITVLEDENVAVRVNDRKLYIAGVSDYSTQQVDLEKTLKGVDSSVILLTHSPDIFDMVPENVDLILAGHTHGGQVILPFIGSILVPSEYGKRFSHGLIKENNKLMIVSKGLGTSILYLRFNCLSEIVVVEFM